MDVSIMFVYTTDYIGYWYVNWILTIYIQISLKKKEKKQFSIAIENYIECIWRQK